MNNLHLSKNIAEKIRSLRIRKNQIFRFFSIVSERCWFKYYCLWTFSHWWTKNGRTSLVRLKKPNCISYDNTSFVSCFVCLLCFSVNYNNNTNYLWQSCVSLSTVRDLLHRFLYAADTLVRTAHLDKAKSTAVTEANAILAKLTVLYAFFQIYASSALVSLIYPKLFRELNFNLLYCEFMF